MREGRETENSPKDRYLTLAGCLCIIPYLVYAIIQKLIMVRNTQCLAYLIAKPKQLKYAFNLFKLVC